MHRRAACVVAGLCLAALARAGDDCPPISVGLITNSGTGDFVAADLLATGRFQSIITIVAEDTLPDPALFDGLDAVLVFPVGGTYDANALGDMIAAFHDVGGGVVTAIPETSDFPPNLGGRWIDEGYAAMTRGTLFASGHLGLGETLAGHPVARGVHFIDGGALSLHSAGELLPGATLVASWSNGSILAATRTVGTHDVVELGLYPLSDSIFQDDTYWDPLTDVPTLIANALYHASGCNVAEPATVGGVAWHDLSGDGIRQRDEPLLPGTTAYLLDGGGQRIARTMAGADGRYRFSRFAAQDCRVEFTVPESLGMEPGQTLFSTDFETDASAMFDVVGAAGDNAADFSYDYSGYRSPDPNHLPAEIPVSPSGPDDGFRALRLDANKNDDNAAPDGVSAFARGMAGVADCIVSFDVFMSYNGNAGGGVGSTEYFSAGRGAFDSGTMWPQNGTFSGWFWAMTGEGGAVQDYRYYADNGATLVASHLTPAWWGGGNLNSSDPGWQSFFSDSQTRGTPGKRWVTVETTLHADGRVEVHLSHSTAPRMLAGRWTASTAGSPAVGYFDDFASIANPREDNFGLVDNFSIRTLPALEGFFTVADAGSDDAVDSDADATTGITDLFAVVPPQTVDGIDAGMRNDTPEGESLLCATEFGDVWGARNADGALLGPVRWGALGYHHDAATHWQTVVGDWNADGLSDIAAVNEFGEMWRAFNDGNAGFAQNARWEEAGSDWLFDEARQAKVLVLGLADPLPDLIVQVEGDRLAWSGGELGLPWAIHDPAIGRWCGAGDVDADGNDDILAVDEAGNAWACLTDIPAGGPSPMQALGALGFAASRGTIGDPFSARGIVAGDFNGDGRSDLALLDGPTHAVLVALSAAGSAPALAAPGSWGTLGFHNAPHAGEGWAAFAADIDGDGIDDLLQINAAGEAWIARSTGASFEGPNVIAQTGFHHRDTGRWQVFPGRFAPAAPLLLGGPLLDAFRSRADAFLFGADVGGQVEGHALRRPGFGIAAAGRFDLGAQLVLEPAAARRGRLDRAALLRALPRPHGIADRHRETEDRERKQEVGVEFGGDHRSTFDPRALSAFHGLDRAAPSVAVGPRQQAVGSGGFDEEVQRPPVLGFDDHQPQGFGFEPSDSRCRGTAWADHRKDGRRRSERFGARGRLVGLQGEAHLHSVIELESAHDEEQLLFEVRVGAVFRQRALAGALAVAQRTVAHRRHVAPELVLLEGAAGGFLEGERHLEAARDVRPVGDDGAHDVGGHRHHRNLGDLELLDGLHDGLRPMGPVGPRPVLARVALRRRHEREIVEAGFAVDHALGLVDGDLRLAVAPGGRPGPRGIHGLGERALLRGDGAGRGDDGDNSPQHAACVFPHGHPLISSSSVRRVCRRDSTSTSPAAVRAKTMSKRRVWWAMTASLSKRGMTNATPRVLRTRTIRPSGGIAMATRPSTSPRTPSACRRRTSSLMSEGGASIPTGGTAAGEGGGAGRAAGAAGRRPMGDSTTMPPTASAGGVSMAVWRCDHPGWSKPGARAMWGDARKPPSAGREWSAAAGAGVEAVARTWSIASRSNCASATASFGNVTLRRW